MLMFMWRLITSGRTYAIFIHGICEYRGKKSTVFAANTVANRRYSELWSHAGRPACDVLFQIPWIRRKNHEERSILP